MFLVWILFSAISVIVFWLVFWSIVNFINNRSNYQIQFSNGKIPTKFPEGFYVGEAHLLADKKVPWLGKSFISNKNLGYNIFTPNGTRILKLLTPFYEQFYINAEGNFRAYYFKTKTKKGLKDTETEVIRLDYNAAENPFLIRIILDEIVEIAPSQYLGKVHLKIFPGIYSTIGYFGLRKT